LLKKGDSALSSYPELCRASRDAQSRARLRYGNATSFQSVVSAPDTGYQSVHELPASIEISITQAQEMMTGDNNAPTDSPLQPPHRIVANAGLRCSAIAQLFVDGQSNGHGICVRGY
jgi:hypothetical protein